MENVCGLHVTQVTEALASENQHRLLIIDCRSFMSFNRGRIVQSINIHCPPILKRRSGGFISLENIVPCERRRRELQTGILTDVLIYDDNTVHLSQAPKDSNLLSVVKSLLKQVVGVTIRFIIGRSFDFQVVRLLFLVKHFQSRVGVNIVVWDWVYDVGRVWGGIFSATIII